MRVLSHALRLAFGLLLLAAPALAAPAELSSEDRRAAPMARPPAAAGEPGGEAPLRLAQLGALRSFVSAFLRNIPVPPPAAIAKGLKAPRLPRSLAGAASELGGTTARRTTAHLPSPTAARSALPDLGNVARRVDDLPSPGLRPRASLDLPPPRLSSAGAAALPKPGRARALANASDLPLSLRNRVLNWTGRTPKAFAAKAWRGVVRITPNPRNFPGWVKRNPWEAGLITAQLTLGVVPGTVTSAAIRAKGETPAQPVAQPTVNSP